VKYLKKKTKKEIETHYRIKMIYMVQKVLFSFAFLQLLNVFYSVISG